jgi:hypothetical protein
MKRREIVFDKRRNWPTKLALVAFLASLAGLAQVVLRDTPGAQRLDARQTGTTPRASLSPTVNDSFAAPTPAALAPAPGEAATPPLANPAPRKVVPHPIADVPYRFIGRSASDTETSIVLFGRGRIVTVRGAAQLDDEYSVDAVFDEYLVVRHIPTGVGRFLSLAKRQQSAELPGDPEDLPRD